MFSYVYQSLYHMLVFKCHHTIQTRKMSSCINMQTDCTHSLHWMSMLPSPLNFSPQHQCTQS